MPAKDVFHDAVKHALQKEGWQITHDPLFLRFGGVELPRRLIERYNMRLIVYDLESEVIVKWQP